MQQLVLRVTNTRSIDILITAAMTLTTMYSPQVVLRWIIDIIMRNSSGDMSSQGR